jgi:hypothetical protein
LAASSRDFFDSSAQIWKLAPILSSENSIQANQSEDLPDVWRGMGYGERMARFAGRAVEQDERGNARRVDARNSMEIESDRPALQKWQYSLQEELFVVPQ